jgi:hypothetical protein
MPIIFATCDKRLPTFVTFERSVFYHLNPEPTRRSGRTHFMLNECLKNIGEGGVAACMYF